MGSLAGSLVEETLCGDQDHKPKVVGVAEGSTLRLALCVPLGSWTNVF